MTRINGEFETIEVGLKPDGIFSVKHDGKRNPSNFFLEIDRGTMPIRSTNFHRSSILKKYIGYADTHRRGLVKELFGFRNFRVLLVTTTEARAQTMRELWHDMFPELPKMVLFTSQEKIDSKGILDAWLTSTRLKADLE